MQTNLQSRPSNGTAPAASSKLSRMTLGAVTRGVVQKPHRILVYGVPGVGKTTFAAGAPSPVFVPLEEGTNQLDVARFPRPERWTDVLEAVDALTNDPHEFKTVVFDTLDAAEALVFRSVCEAAGKRSISDFAHGAGYVAAVDVWRSFIARVERLVETRGVHVIFIAHSTIRTFQNPEGADYDRFGLKLYEKAASLFVEWCDDVLFARLVARLEPDGEGKWKPGGSVRVLSTYETPTFRAKNRHALPPTLPISWADLERAIAAARPDDPSKLREEIASLAARLEGAPADLFHKERFEKSLAAAGNDAAALARIKDHLGAKLAQKES